MSRSALVIGGTGPTGPYLLNGLIDRGYDVTIFHRGSHEPPGLPDVPHIHGDPFMRESIDKAVGKGEYDLVLATYGRTLHVAQSFEGRAGKFISVGGTPRYAGVFGVEGQPSGTAIPLREDSPLVSLSGCESNEIPAFFDRFDYDLEDRLLDSWWQYLDNTSEKIPQFLPDDEHPMPHPKRPNQKVDEKNR